MVKRSDTRHAILAAGLLVTLAALACRAPVRPYVCAVDMQAVGVDVDVHSVWTCNRKVLYRAARKKAFSLREFREAAAFFEQLIDFQVDTQPSHLGVLPGPDLKQDVRDLDAWYELNHGKLRWDAGLGKIVYAGLASSAGAD
jgi:hypothetical protein